ncbi:pheST operon leader peptide PheM [Escherichia coli]|uniref:pheST attenuator peptide n=1 Tax=Salmonella enterica TaxID=28901 RepID=A0A744G4T3_SALER|nr:pheST operon leader peptide PheM [Salmonella enterica]EEB6066981.1 pheST operon leader peptide PheM [Salmonella enterica subsp. enterica serovar Bareilly]EDZ3963342.1 pheST operon leader peptide PheM [Salmonella enterica]EEY1260252.1 pheST operon leader peptide PheM [Salmonella enterica]EFO8607665.1 pheST operon leader peptide PheM [Salmonella enterica]
MNAAIFHFFFYFST